MQCWGATSLGGDCDGLDLMGTDKVYATQEAFVAVKSDGIATCWGAPGSGGVCVGLDLYGYKVFSNHKAFVAVSEDGHGRPLPHALLRHRQRLPN